MHLQEFIFRLHLLPDNGKLSLQTSGWESDAADNSFGNIGGIILKAIDDNDPIGIISDDGAHSRNYFWSQDGETS
jgi:hypothetical protein